MENVWVLASVWVRLALIATLVAIWFKISTALSEIVVGTASSALIGCTAIAHYVLHWTGRSGWLAGVALSMTSLTVVCAVMLEPGSMSPILVRRSGREVGRRSCVTG